MGHLDRYKNLKVFDGNSKDFEEWNVTFRSLINAGDTKVGRLLTAVEQERSEEELAKNKYDQIQPEFDERDLNFVNESSAEMFNLLLSIPAGEANSAVRRSLGSRWLAWKRLTSSLNPRTLASRVKAISAVLAPPRVSQATKADRTLEEWDDRLVNLGTEYGQELTAKVRVAVLHGMMSEDVQDKVLDACAVNWDETAESEAGRLHTKIKVQLWNIQGKARYGRSEADGSGSSCRLERVGTATRSKLRRSTAMRRAARFPRTLLRLWRVWALAVGLPQRQGQRERIRQGLWQGWRTRQRLRQGRLRWQRGRQRKGRRWQWRHAEGLLGVWVYGAYHQGLPEEHERPESVGGHPRDSLHRQRAEQRSTGRMEEDAMKVTLGDFVKDSPRAPIQKTQIGRTGVAKNRFKVLEVDDPEEEEGGKL